MAGVPDRSDDELMRRLHARAEEIRESGAVSPTLMVQLLSDLSIVSDRMTLAEAQRTEIRTKLDEVLRQSVDIRLMQQTMQNVLNEQKEMRAEIKVNTDFRVRLLGGSAVVRIIWLALGGLGLYALQKLFERGGH